jgi:hypothetical protein
MIGRLGNQMFQIANVYAQSLRHNRQLVLPRNDTSVSDYFTTVHRKLEFLIDRSPNDGPDIHTIHGTHQHQVYLPHPTKPTVFRGYYETEKYFKDYSESVRWLFGPTPEFVAEALRDYPQLSSGPVSAVIVRRGDFLTQPTRHPVVTAGYLHAAHALLPKTNHTFVVSDDIPWCRENLHLPNMVFVSYVTWKALWLLSLCDHFVISNSTFTWWGAWLSRAPNKVVVTPSTWFGPDLQVDQRDIRCEGWLQVPTEYRDGFIHLK